MIFFNLLLRIILITGPVLIVLSLPLYVALAVLVGKKWIKKSLPFKVAGGVATFLISTAVSLVCWYDILWFWNPLPSDEEMIENFQAHRDDFIEIVRRYREYPDLPEKARDLWFKDNDTLELLKRAGVDCVDYDGTTPWLPNPYSLETAMNMEIMPSSKDFGIFYRYGLLRIQPATTPRIDHPEQTDHRRHYGGSIIHGVFWKQYVFFPEAPRIENGILFGPLQITHKGDSNSVFHEKEGVSTWQYKERVLPSLNRRPRDWKGFECVYRQIEPQWFLRMCNGSF